MSVAMTDQDYVLDPTETRTIVEVQQRFNDYDKCIQVDYRTGQPGASSRVERLRLLGSRRGHPGAVTLITAQGHETPLVDPSAYGTQFDVQFAINVVLAAVDTRHHRPGSSASRDGVGR